MGPFIFIDAKAVWGFPEQCYKDVQNLNMQLKYYVGLSGTAVE